MEVPKLIVRIDCSPKNRPASVNATTLYFATFTPIFFATTSLLPIAYVYVPTFVYFRMNAHNR